MVPSDMPPIARLGFGCNSLLGPKPRSEGRALLETAFDAGVRHFDVARGYSSGDAEGLVGEFLAGRRDQVTVTTKFGLQPPSGGLAKSRWIKDVARRLMRISPGLRRMLGKRSRQMVQPGQFAPDQAIASLAVSLAELKIDRIDTFLLHEPAPTDCTDELRDALDGAVRDGKIGRFGVGTGIDHALTIAADRPAFADVLQIPASVVDRNLDRLPALPPSSTVITHGAISAPFTRLRTYLAAHPEVAKSWSDSLTLDLADPATLAPLMLAYSVASNPGGIVLFSSTKPATIRSNVRAILDRRFPPDQLAQFATLVAEHRIVIDQTSL